MVGVAGGVMAPLSCIFLSCKSTLVERKRIGESGGVDINLANGRPDSFSDVVAI